MHDIDSSPVDFDGWLEKVWRLAAWPLILFFLIPLLALIFEAMPNRLVTGLQDEQMYLALSVSLRTTFISLLATLALGTPLAYVMGRCRFPFKRLVDTLIDLPTVLPPSVAGLALLLAFGRRGLLGEPLQAIGLQIAFTPLAVVMAQVFVSASYYVRAAALGFALIDRELVQAAQLDGANWWQVFRFLILPLSRPALVNGAALSWARALGEFGATILFAGNFPGRTQTMPLAIYLGFEARLDVAITLSILLLGVSSLVLLFVRLRTADPAAHE